MAKPKGHVGPVGWGSDKMVEVLAERDVNQVKNRKRGLGQTWSSHHFVRQLGFAKRVHGGAATYHIYTHSQVSNAVVARGGWMYAPPAFVGLTREDLEWLVMVALQELYGDKS